MVIRPIKSSDYAKLNALYAKAPSKYGNAEMDFAGRNFIAGLVAVDDEDEPRLLLGFRRTAEAHVIVDHDFDVPAYRLVALGELIAAAKPLMSNLGYDDVFATVGPDVPRSYLRRLKKLGCGILENWALVKMWKET
jgi:hypothetical protein